LIADLTNYRNSITLQSLIRLAKASMCTSMYLGVNKCHHQL
jgi:hypothetical protein